MNPKTQPDARLEIFFDGLCPLCSREIDHYRKQAGSENLLFTDITLPEFDASDRGLDPIEVHHVMHVKTTQGEIKTGIDAFISIWEILPRYRWLARLGKAPPMHFCLQSGYLIFAQIRPYLPRKTRECAQSPYCVVEADIQELNK
jgi:hypothetical protein